MIQLSISEYEIMSLLWSEGRGLTAMEINLLSPEKSWKDSSIHLILTNMLDKGAITVDGIVRSGRTYGRMFQAALSREEYYIMQMQQNAASANEQSAVYTGLISTLINSNSISDSDLDKIEAMLKKRKKSLDGSN